MSAMRYHCVSTVSPIILASKRAFWCIYNRSPMSRNAWYNNRHMFFVKKNGEAGDASRLYELEDIIFWTDLGLKSNFCKKRKLYSFHKSGPNSRSSRLRFLKACIYKKNHQKRIGKLSSGLKKGYLCSHRPY